MDSYYQDLEFIDNRLYAGYSSRVMASDDFGEKLFYRLPDLWILTSISRYVFH